MLHQDMLQQLKDLKAKEDEATAAQASTSSSAAGPAAGSSSNSNAGSSSSPSNSGSRGNSNRNRSSNRPQRSMFDKACAGERMFGGSAWFESRSKDLFNAISVLFVNPARAGPENAFVVSRKRALPASGSTPAAAGAGQTGAAGRGGGGGGAGRGGGGRGRGGRGAAAGGRGGVKKREKTLWGDDEQEQMEIAETAAGVHPDAAGADYLYFDDIVNDQGERLWPGER